MLIWMFRFKQNRHFNPLGGSLLKMCVFWWGRLVQQMLAGLCKPLRWYAPATTRREPVPGGSLMSPLTSNGRVRGVPAQRQKLGSCWWFFFQRLGVCRRAGGAGLCRPSVFRVGNCSCISDTSAVHGGRMKTASLQGRTCSVSARPCTPARPGTDLQQGRTNGRGRHRHTKMQARRNTDIPGK